MPDITSWGIWPTEVLQCASSVIPAHPMNNERREALLSHMNAMFLRRENPADIQRTAHMLARRQQIEIARPDADNGLVVVGFAGGGGGKSQLVSAFLAKHYGGNYTGPGTAMDEPAHTVTTVDHHAIVAAHLMVNNTGHPGGSADGPTHTITTGNHHALVTSNLIKMRGTNTGQHTDTPLQTVTAGGNHFGEVRAFLIKYYGNEREGVDISDPMHTVVSRDRFGLVTVEGVDYQIIDIGMRMLQPHELYAAQGFPPDYIIDRDEDGNAISKSDQVARCGNAVCPPVARALVYANLPEYCIGEIAA